MSVANKIEPEMLTFTGGLVSMPMQLIVRPAPSAHKYDN